MLKHTQVWLVGKFMFSQKNGRMAKNSITYLFNTERYQLKMQILQFGIYKTTGNGNTGLIFDNLQCKNLYTA